MRLNKNACLVCRCNGELPNSLFSCMKNVNFEFRSLLLIFDFLLFVFARAAGGAYFAPRAILVGGAVVFLKGKTNAQVLFLLRGTGHQGQSLPSLEHHWTQTRLHLVSYRQQAPPRSSATSGSVPRKYMISRNKNYVFYFQV